MRVSLLNQWHSLPGKVKGTNYDWLSTVCQAFGPHNNGTHHFKDDKTKVVAQAMKAGIFPSQEINSYFPDSQHQNTLHDVMSEWNGREELLPSRRSLLLTMPRGTPCPAGATELNPTGSHHLQGSNCHLGKLAFGSGVLSIKCTHLWMILRLMQMDVRRQERILLVRDIDGKSLIAILIQRLSSWLSDLQIPLPISNDQVG